MLLLDSLTKSDFDKAQANGLFPHITSIFAGGESISEARPGEATGWACRGAGSKDRVYHGLPIFLNVPFTQKKKKATVEVNNTRKLKDYVLTPFQLVENGYPLTEITATSTTTSTSTTISPESLVSCTSTTSSTTKITALASVTDSFMQFGDSDTGLPLVGIDCEMCRTSVGLELTRVSVVDENENVLYDSFVKPKNDILDYLTRFSGVSAKDLAGVSTRVEDVQDALKKWITSNTIIVGHSLENDLLALKIVHRNVADTSVLYPHDVDGAKNSLKFLSNKFLKQSIQHGEHNSVEDAIAAMRLFKLKVLILECLSKITKACFLSFHNIKRTKSSRSPLRAGKLWVTIAKAWCLLIKLRSWPNMVLP